MSEVYNSEILSKITLHSTPNITEVVSLFSGMLVKRSLKNFARVIHSKYSLEPLGVGNRSSRFGSTSVVAERFGSTPPQVMYGARSIDTAIYESIVRNKFDIKPDRILQTKDYIDRSVVQFSTESSELISLLDLTNGNAACYGVPTDVIRSSDHSEGQNFSQFVFENMCDIDGFIYTSRFTEGECVALYHNRVNNKLHTDKQFELEQSSVSIALSSLNIEVL